MSPGEFRVWSISGGVLKPPTRPLNLSFFFFLRFWQCWVLTLTVLLHPRTPRTPPLVFLLAVTSSQMVVASFVWGLRTPPCSTELIPARNTNICCHYPDIRPHVYTIACRCRGDGERGCLFVNATPYSYNHPPTSSKIHLAHPPAVVFIPLYRHLLGKNWGRSNVGLAMWLTLVRRPSIKVPVTFWRLLVEGFFGVKPGSEASRGLFSRCISALRCLLWTVEALQGLQRVEVRYSLYG